jgi:hypothetical protein
MRRKSIQRSCKKSIQRRRRSCKRSKEDGVKRKRSLLLTEKIPADIDKYEYDVDDNIYDELKPSDLDFLLHETEVSDVETIPEESLQEYKTLKPLKKMDASFNRKYYNCPDCKEPQYSRDNLTEHFLKVHKKSMYICPEEDCNYKSARLTDINKHKNKKHKK